MEEPQQLTNKEIAGWAEVIQRGFGGVHEGHPRCGHYLYFIDGIRAELGCTRKKGHAKKHRIRMRVVGRRGRKHYSWPEPRLLVAFALAE